MTYAYRRALLTILNAVSDARVEVMVNVDLSDDERKIVLRRLRMITRLARVMEAETKDGKVEEVTCQK